MSFMDYMVAQDAPGFMFDTIESVFDWMEEHLSDDWRFTTRTVSTTRYGYDDVRIEIWFSFDSAEDAMLSRITWTELIHPKHADAGGLLRET